MKKENNNITELVLILDRSGSMAGLEGDTIGGFNAMIEKQRKQEGVCFVSTVLFDHEREVLHDRVPLETVAPMTEKEYTVRGSTALIDAIGASVRHIENIHKYAREEDRPGQTVFVVITDGQENASHRYTSDEVKRMIERKKEESGWEFLFIGANIDAVETAKHFGITADRAVDYRADARGTRVLYETIGAAIGKVRAKKAINADWGAAIAEDFKQRS